MSGRIHGFTDINAIFIAATVFGYIIRRHFVKHINNILLTTQQRNAICQFRQWFVGSAAAAAAAAAATFSGSGLLLFLPPLLLLISLFQNRRHCCTPYGAVRGRAFQRIANNGDVDVILTFWCTLALWVNNLYIFFGQTVNWPTQQTNATDD